MTTNNGGADEDRTRDPLLAKQVLSHLSYSPHGNSGSKKRPIFQDCDRDFESCNRWWAWVELNYRPHAYQACALTN